MLELAELLGQGAVEERLTSDLEQPGARVVRLTGPAGSGKSHIARLVASGWVERGGGCVVAVGDVEHSFRDLYPLLLGLSRAHADWVGLATTGARSAIQVADTALGGASVGTMFGGARVGAVLGGAGVGTSVFDLLRAAFRQRIERVLRPYSSLERDVIVDLKRLTRSRGLLIVADNAHWWDADSLRLLQDVLGDDLRQGMPQLSSIVALLVDTADEQPAVAPGPFGALVAMCERHTQRTKHCTREQFPEILKAFGLDQQLPDEVLGSLFSATNGHLKLAEQVSAYAEHGSIGTLVGSIDSSYLSTLVSARFASLGSFSPEVTDMLARAAVLGLSFNEEDLLCIAGGTRSNLQTLVERAESIGFVERDAGRIVFSHDVIRSAILTDQTSSQLAGLHTKLSECLAILRPGDYGARAQAQLQAGDVEGARGMIALASVAQLRRGVPVSGVLRRVVLQFPDDSELASYVEMIADAYSAVGSGDFVAPLPSLRTPLPSETKLMAAERNYLAALCQMELQTAASVAEAQAILSSWIPSLSDEIELCLRFMLLLQQAQVLSELFDEARATESRIEQQLLDRVRYDLDAAATLQIQNRRAAAVNAPEIAELRIGEAVAFFRRGTSDTARDQLELFRSLNNLAAIQIRLGKDDEAYAHAQEAERVALDWPDVVKRLDVLASNIVLSGYRSGALDVSEAVARQRLIIDSPDGSEDNFIHRCNLAAYLLLASRDVDAAEELRLLEDELQDRELDETYLIFYLAALSVGSAALRGDQEEAMRRHTEMDAFVQSLKWPCAAHVRRRQRLLGELLGTFRPGDSRPLADRVLLDAHPSEVGPGWTYYARLIPCSELSFWSDS